jgi:hypothetical protein
VPAVSSLPGQAPIHDPRCFDEGNIAAAAPTSVIDLLRGIDTEARNLGESVDRVMMLTEEVRHLLVELRKVVFDHAQIVQRELHEPLIHRVEIGARAKDIAQLLGRRSLPAPPDSPGARRAPRGPNSRKRTSSLTMAGFHLKAVTLSQRSCRSGLPQDLTACRA